MASNLSVRCIIGISRKPYKIKAGWANRSTIDAFVRYSEIVFKEFEGKIDAWITLNEPWCVSFLSNYLGIHAPGFTDLQLAVDISHHLMVAHGRTVRKFRELGIKGTIGYAPNVTWIEPYSPLEADVQASRRSSGWFTDWFFEPIFKGTYPEYLVKWFEAKGAVLNVEPGDLADIKQPIDFLGINGACYNDEPGEDGRVGDQKRIAYLSKHLTQLNRVIAAGVPVKGYFVWSLLDNFEWAEGYSKRFGIVHVNYQTLQRTKKDNYYWYQQVATTSKFSI